MPCTELSKYTGETATPEQIRQQCKKLQAAFPQMPPEMIGVLVDRCRETEIKAERLRDAVNNLIDTCKYPIPTVADVLSFDKKVKLYTHAEVVASIPLGLEFKDYEMITVNDQKRWIRK